MATLEELNVRSEWVAHEFRVMGREHGWLIKKTGVESLFSNRLGVLKYLQYQFSPVSLMLRSQPDMIFHGNNDAIYSFEVKAVEDAHDNVAVEAWQFLYLYTLYLSLGVETYYVFGWPVNDIELHGRITVVSKLPLTKFYITPKYLSWNEGLRKPLEKLIKEYYPGIERRNLTEGHGGSGDPYFVFPKEALRGFQTIADWFKAKGEQSFSIQDRIAWEGMKEAKEHWKSWRYKEWLRIHSSKNDTGRQ